MTATSVTRVDLLFVPTRRHFVILEACIWLERSPVSFWVKAPIIDVNMETTLWEGCIGVVDTIRQYHRVSSTIG